MSGTPPTIERAPNGLRLAVAPIRNVIVRDGSATGDGSWTIEGYAAVYEQETTLYDVPGWIRMDEEIARGAFENVLDGVRHGTELVHLNHGHDMKTVMAASDVSGVGGLELAEDFHGLRFFARVDPDDPDAKGLAVKMGRGVVKQSSFAFNIGAEEMVESEVLEDGTWYSKWRILEVAHLYDVCVCAQGAYPQTESFLRSLAAASLRVPDLGAPGRTGLDPVGRDRRAGLDPAGVADIAPSEGEGKTRALELAQLRAHAGATLRNIKETTQ